MVKRLTTLDVECDSPPYAIVRACHQVGLQRPEDVRWVRMSRCLASQRGGRDLPGYRRGVWSALFRRRAAKPCVCGHRLPMLAKCTFTFKTGGTVSYWMGQCQRCRTIFWDVR
jgi:hypothetical protein